MAFLSYQDTLNYIRGNQPQEAQEQGPIVISSGPGTGAQAGSVASASGTPTSSGPSQEPQMNTFVQQPTSVGSKVLSPIRTGLETQQQALSDAYSQFEQQAGPSQTFESIGGAQTLGTAIETTPTAEEFAQRMEAAKGVVGKQYEGPSGLSSEALTPIQTSTTDLTRRAEGLQTGGGVQVGLREALPQLTAADRLYETKQLLIQPEFRQQRADLIKSVGEFQTDIAEKTQEAKDLASKRVQEATDIREAAKEFLTGRRGEIDEQLAQSIEQAKATNKQIEDAYNVWQETGDPAGLEALGVDMSGFDTQARQEAAQAEQVWQSIVNDPKYASIADINPQDVGLGVTKRGREADAAYFGRWLTEHGLSPEQGRLLRNRQRELEQAGFSPGSTREMAASPVGTAYRALIRRRQIDTRVAELEKQEMDEKEIAKTLALEFPQMEYVGKYSKYKPLYWAGEVPGGPTWEPPDLQEYVFMKLGTRPSRENLSTEEQRIQYNNIQELLNEVGRLEKANNPFQAASIAVEIERYIEDELQSLIGREQFLDRLTVDWMNQVRYLRKKYRKAKSKGKWGAITGYVVGAIGGAVGFVVGGPVGAARGYSAGSTIGQAVGPQLEEI